MSQTIEIIVKSDGQTHIQTKGFTGSSCGLASGFIEQALGQQTSEQRTAEFYQQVSQPQSHQLKGGAH